MALDAKKLMFAFAGVIVWALGAMCINFLSDYAAWAIPVAGGVAAILVIILVAAQSDRDLLSKKFLLTLGLSTLAIIIIVTVLIAGVSGKDAKLLQNIYKTAWTLAAASFFGTAICRIAALDAATEETVGPRETARFALKKLSTSIWTLLTPVIAVVAVGLVLLTIGFLIRIPYAGPVLYFLVGLFYLFALLAGLFFAVMLLVYIPGLTLFQPAIGAEGNDAFDAISRAYSFVFGRPWRLLFYGIVGAVYSKIVLAVVAVMFVWAGGITTVFLKAGAGSKMASNNVELGDVFTGAKISEDTIVIPGMSGMRTGKLEFSNDPVANVRGAAEYIKGVIFGNPLSGPVVKAGQHVLGGNTLDKFKEAKRVGGWLIIFWQHILLAIFLAFAVSFIYSLFTQIYFLMRKACDGTPFEEIYVEAPEEEAYAADFPEKTAEEKAAEKAEAADKGAAESKPAPAKKASAKKAEKDDAIDDPIDLAGEDEKKESE
jgi:hypothetical protein